MREPESIYQQLKQSLERRSGVGISDGGDMGIRLSAVAAELSSLWTQLDWTEKQIFPQTATGEYLDHHTKARDLERGTAAYACGELSFETARPAASELFIAKGTVCLNSGGTEFETLENANITAGTSACTVRARAKKPGSLGNVPPESICFMALAPVGVARCRNALAFSGGTDGESDEALRGRILASYACLPNGSNRAFYEARALNTEGVAAACVLPKARGLGTVDIIISSTEGMPEDALVLRLGQTLQAEREICVDVAVSKPEPLPVRVQTEIDIKDGFKPETVLAQVTGALKGYFDGRLLGKDILLAQLGSIIFSQPGVLNYRILAPAADIKVSSKQLPVAGSITVTGR